HERHRTQRNPRKAERGKEGKDEGGCRLYLEEVEMGLEVLDRDRTSGRRPGTIFPPPLNRGSAPLDPTNVLTSRLEISNPTPLLSLRVQLMKIDVTYANNMV